MVRHMRDRPVAMEAFPNGIGGQGHFMKDRPKHFPDWIPDVRVAKRGGSLRHILVCETATLVYLAGQNVITPHVWTSRADDVRKPDRIIFDLDPSTQKFAEVRAAARATGELLRELGLSPHAMVTGSRGIHVTVPIKRVPFEEAFAFAKAVALRLAEEHPKKLTTEFLKANRERPDLRRRAAQPVRAARGASVRGAPSAKGARCRAAPLGGAGRLQAEAGPLDDQVDARARGVGRRCLARHQRPRPLGQRRSTPTWASQAAMWRPISSP